VKCRRWLHSPVWHLPPNQCLLTSFTACSANPPQKHLFTLSEGLGTGAPVFAWSGRGELLAGAGQPRAVLIFARGGDLLDTLELPGPEFPFSDRLPSARQLQAPPQPAHGCSSVSLLAKPPGRPFSWGYPDTLALLGPGCPSSSWHTRSRHRGRVFSAAGGSELAAPSCCHSSVHTLLQLGSREVQDLLAAHAAGRSRGSLFICCVVKVLGVKL
jgi:hypothetical protein